MTTTTTTARLQFGYNAGIPNGVTAAWGARWIADRNGVQQLADRQDTFGPPSDVQDLLNHLYSKANEKLFATANKLVKSGEIRGDTAEEFVLYEDLKIIVKGNTQRSHGYLYVVAYPRPLVTDHLGRHHFNLIGAPRFTGENSADGKFPLVEVSGVLGKWSNRELLPEIGRRVYCVMNSLKWGTVIAYFEEAGFLGVEVRLENPPASWIKQNIVEKRYGLRANALLFGCDLHPGK